MRETALRALDAIKVFSASMDMAESTAERKFAWSNVRHGLIMFSIGAGFLLLWYADWLPKVFAERLEENRLFFFFFLLAFAAFGLVVATTSYLNLRAQRLGTERARKQALAAWIVSVIAVCILLLALGALLIFLIGGIYYWSGSAIARWLTGDLYWFPSDLISAFAIMLAIPLVFHIRHVSSWYSSWIGRAKNAGLIFALIVLVAPFSAVQVISTLHLLWRFVQMRLMDESWTDSWKDLIVWIIGIVLNGLNVFVATFLIWFIVLAVRRLRALRTAKRRLHRIKG